MVALLFVSCDEPANPKPKGQLRLALPEHSYQPLEMPCPFDSEIPEYSTTLLRKNEGGNCWFNLSFPQQRATIHFTYKPVEENLGVLVDEAIKLTYDHHIKADGINSTNYIDTLNHVYGTLFEVTGEVASSTQFYLTDSTNHFLRASLYFNAAPNQDSLAPVTAFVREDIQHFMQSLRWRN
jgi:gliding motility-associated lipoprotein GldD